MSSPELHAPCEHRASIAHRASSLELRAAAHVHKRRFERHLDGRAPQTLQGGIKGGHGRAGSLHRGTADGGWVRVSAGVIMTRHQRSASHTQARRGQGQRAERGEREVHVRASRAAVQPTVSSVH